MMLAAAPTHLIPIQNTVLVDVSTRYDGNLNQFCAVMHALKHSHRMVEPSLETPCLRLGFPPSDALHRARCALHVHIACCLLVLKRAPAALSSFSGPRRLCRGMPFSLRTTSTVSRLHFTSYLTFSATGAGSTSVAAAPLRTSPRCSSPHSLRRAPLEIRWARIKWLSCPSDQTLCLVQYAVFVCGKT